MTTAERAGSRILPESRARPGSVARSTTAPSGTSSRCSAESKFTRISTSRRVRRNQRAASSADASMLLNAGSERSASARRRRSARGRGRASWHAGPLPPPPRRAWSGGTCSGSCGSGTTRLVPAHARELGDPPLGRRPAELGLGMRGEELPRCARGPLLTHEQHRGERRQHGEHGRDRETALIERLREPVAGRRDCRSGRDPG